MGREGQGYSFPEHSVQGQKEGNPLFSIANRPLSPGEYPDQENIDIANSGTSGLETKKTRLVRKANAGVSTIATALIAGASAIGGGAGGFFLKDKISASGEEKSPTHTAEPADSVPGGISLNQERGIVDEREVFDNNATSGVITAEMKKRIPEEETQQMDTFEKFGRGPVRTITKKEEDIRELSLGARLGAKGNIFEVVVGENENTLRFTFPFDLSESDNPEAGIRFEKEESMPNWVRELLQDAGYQGERYFNVFRSAEVPKGTIMVAPEDGRLVDHTSPTYRKTGKPMDVALESQTPNGIPFTILIMNQGSRFEDLVGIPHPEDARGNGPIMVGDFGTSVEKGQRVLKTTGKSDDIVIIVSSHRGGEPVPKEGGGYIKRTIYVPFNIEFFTSDGKLVISEWASNIVDTTGRALGTTRNFAVSSLQTIVGNLLG